MAIGVSQGGLGPEYHDWRPALLADRCPIKFTVRYGPGQSAESVLAELWAVLDRPCQADPDLAAEVKRNLGGQRILMGPFEVERDADSVGAVEQTHHRAVRGRRGSATWRPTSSTGPTRPTWRGPHGVPTISRTPATLPHERNPLWPRAWRRE